MSQKSILPLLFLFTVADLLCFACLLAAEDSITSNEDIGVLNVTAAGSNRSKDDSLAGIIDRALEKEFTENDEQSDATDPGSFNNSVAGQQAVLETVARVKSKRNESKEEKSFQLHDVFNLENENGPEDTPRLIDSNNNVFIMSNPKSKYPVLQLDLRLISDLVVVIVSATCGGIAFACAGQPVITGYLLAGSLIGPGGLSFVNELVQVETVAQFGVIFLLFALGLEFSAAKLRVVRTVAILGGLLQIFLFMCLSGLIAVLCGGEASEGVFVGAFLSMSSTAVVLKFLMEKNSINTLYGQVTVGTLILQDCAVGLLFALLPILGGTSRIFEGMLSMTKMLVTLVIFLAVLSVFSRTCIPWFFNLMIRLSSQTNELYQLASVAFCLIVASGLSLELGSFAAGVMISTTDLAKHTLEQVEPIRNFFAALFLASIGMLIHVQFLWIHIDILLAAVILVVVIKTIVVATVVKGFRYTNKTALLVGMSLAQIGEFAFVLLSRASNLHLIEGKLYLLLLGTTALSLVTTPFLFKLIPAVVHLGVLLRWFTPDIPTEVLIMVQSPTIEPNVVERPSKHKIKLKYGGYFRFAKNSCRKRYCFGYQKCIYIDTYIYNFSDLIEEVTKHYPSNRNLVISLCFVDKYVTDQSFIKLDSHENFQLMLNMYKVDKEVIVYVTTEKELTLHVTTSNNPEISNNVGTSSRDQR